MQALFFVENCRIEIKLYPGKWTLHFATTYIPYNGTFAYLSTILDAFTKQILSYVLSDSLEVDFVLETVNQLIEKHGVSQKAETLMNTDQGDDSRSPVTLWVEMPGGTTS